MKISIVTPIRENILELERLMQSLDDTTTNPSDIEVVFIVDLCDEVLQPKIDMYTEMYKKFNVRFISVERSEHFVRDYYNFASTQAKGRWILAINVDVMFMTKGWDITVNQKMEEKANEVGDDIIYGIIKDGLPRTGDEGLENTNKAIWHEKVDFSCWILTSKEFVNFYGGMMDNENWLWGADHWTGLMWQKVKRGSRIAMIREVFIDHISHHTKDLPQPESFKYFCEIMQRHPMIYNQDMANKEARRIEAYIDEKNIHK